MVLAEFGSHLDLLKSPFGRQTQVFVRMLAFSNLEWLATPSEHGSLQCITDTRLKLSHLTIESSVLHNGTQI